MVRAERTAAATAAEAAVVTTLAYKTTPNAAKDRPTGPQADQTDPRRIRTPTTQTIAGTTTITRKRPLTAKHHARLHQTTARDRETAEGGANNLLGRSPK